MVMAFFAVTIVLRTAHTAETISIWRAGTSHNVAVSRYTDHFSDWLEFEFPPGAAPVRIIPSRHYAWLNDRVVGFNNRSSRLIVHRAIAKSAFSVEQPKESLAIPIPISSEVSGVAVPFPPEHPGAFISLEWRGIFGVRTTHGLSAQGKPDFQITNFVSTFDGVEIKGLTYIKEGGSLKINNALELTEVRLENERVPIFRPKIPNTREEEWNHLVDEEWIQAAEGQRLKLWLASISDAEIAAKAFLNGHEITWIGGRNPRWLFDGISLIGASSYNDKSILISEARPTSLTSAQQQKHLAPVIFRIYQLAADLGLSDEGLMYVRSVKKEGADLVIHFSGVLETPGIPVIRYNPVSGSATVRADEWEMPVKVEPLAPPVME